MRYTCTCIGITNSGTNHDTGAQNEKLYSNFDILTSSNDDI